MYLGNKDIPVLCQRIGSTQTNFYSNPWPSNGTRWGEGKVVVGAFREDEEDPLYKYGSSVLTTPTRLFYSSVTHFFRPDAAPDATNTIEAAGSGIPNANSKIHRYASGNWELMYQAYVANFPTESNGTGSCANQRATLNLVYNGLIDLFNGNIFVKSITWLSGQETVFNQPIKLEPRHWSTANDVSNLTDFTSMLTFEILGRMCHLLGDMSVPVHVKSECHAINICTDADGDSYERFLDVENSDEWLLSKPEATYWDADRVWLNYHNIMNPFLESEDPLYYLMYTMAQITDHFPTDIQDGNDNIPTMNTELLNFYPSNKIPRTVAEFNEDSWSNKHKIRDATIPHVIRAMAGL